MHGYFFEDLSVGMSALFSRTITEADLSMFATVSGDNNPVHMDEEYAKTTRFKGRIAHGMLSASFLSTAIATRLPGPGTIYLRQNLRFMNPVRIGDCVAAKVSITEIIAEKKRVLLNTICSVGDRVVIEGDAMVMVPSRA
jgi:3-hydroxybutyryl-CoA dehydratase